MGPHVAKWFSEKAEAHGKFELESIDLAEVNLPLFDEPEMPRLRKYQNEHTKRWSAIVDRADAYVFVTPEYDFGAPPSLTNALIYLSREWECKPVGYVSYGGVSGGLRSVQMSKLTVTALKMMPLPETVSIPFVAKSIKDGVFDPGDVHNRGVTAMLDELFRWAEALKPLRAG